MRISDWSSDVCSSDLKKVAALEWISLASVLLTAAATLFTGDHRFVMAKPTIVYLIVGTVMLRKGWLNRYIPPQQLAIVGDVMDRFGMIWAALMFASAALNLRSEERRVGKAGVSTCRSRW